MGCDRKRGTGDDSKDFGPGNQKDRLLFTMMETAMGEAFLPFSASHSPSLSPLPSASRPGSKGSLVLLLTAREGGGGGPGLRGSQLRERTGPASGKSVCLSVRARLGGGDTNRCTGQRRGLLPRWSLGLGDSLWPQLRLNKSPHNTSSPTTCLAKEHKLSL